MKKLFLVFLLLIPKTGFSQVLTAVFDLFQSTGRVVTTSDPFNIANRSISNHIFTWSVQQGSLTSCTLSFETSVASTGPWTQQATGNCTTTGTSGNINFAANYFRVNTITWTPAITPTRVTINWAGYVNPPSSIASFSPTNLTNIGNIRYCQNYGGADLGAQIQAAENDLPSQGGVIFCSMPGTNTISTQVIITKPTAVYFYGNFSLTGSALTQGIFWIKGGILSATGGQGSRITCLTYNQNIGLGKIANTSGCTFTYTPSSGTTPVVTIDENGGTINDVEISDINFVVNSAVTNPINIVITGGGAAFLKFKRITIINSATGQGFGGHAINMTCSNAGAAANAQYTLDFEDVSVYNNGSAINGGTGGTNGDGIYLDPTAGTVCGFVGPVNVNRVTMEGLTGTYPIYCKGCFNLFVQNSIINVNNLNASGQVIHAENGSGNPALIAINNQFDDNDYSNNGNVVDIAIPTGSGIISGNLFNGGTKGQTHAEDHAIDLGSGVIGMVIENNYITNMVTTGTNINSGSQQIRYCGNDFKVGNGAALEFATYSAPLNKGCITFNAGTNVVDRIVNMSAGNHYWEWGITSTGNYFVDKDGTNQFTLGSSSNLPLFYFNNSLVSVNPHEAAGTGQLVSGSPSTATITLTGSNVFSAAGTYICIVNNIDTVANALQVANTNASTFVVTGPNMVTYHFNYDCKGN